VDRVTLAALGSPLPSIVRLGVVDSTQSRAFALAADGAPDGTIVVADVQTAGRGRRGRAWRAEPGTSLLVSVLLRPRLPVSELPLLSLTTAVAVAETLSEAGVAARIKWPNDILARGRKIAGILLESRLGRETVVAVGIGVNLGQREFPADLADRATSVLLETGRAPEVEAFLEGLRARFAEWRVRLEGLGFAPVRARWRAMSETLGARVSIDGVVGVARDLDADGALVVADGARVHRIRAGEVDDAARG
jgi:BirA family biotin operon repressor/biotin-[acetyl-CoA-carboxylase] ligase